MTGPLRQLSEQAAAPLRLVQTTPSGAELLERCRAGDAVAWNELVDRYERLVFGVALREGLDREDAADVVQIVFEALLSSLTQIRDTERLSAWLLAVTRRQVWRIRSRRVRELLVSEVEPAEGSTSEQLHGGDGPGSEDVIDLYEALGRLKPACRDLLTALYFDPESPTYEEIAERLGRPLGSIGPSRARCLKHLRQALGEAW